MLEMRGNLLMLMGESMLELHPSRCWKAAHCFEQAVPQLLGLETAGTVDALPEDLAAVFTGDRMLAIAVAHSYGLCGRQLQQQLVTEVKKHAEVASLREHARSQLEATREGSQAYANLNSQVQAANGQVRSPQVNITLSVNAGQARARDDWFSVQWSCRHLSSVWLTATA